MEMNTPKKPDQILFLHDIVLFHGRLYPTSKGVSLIFEKKAKQVKRAQPGKEKLENVGKSEAAEHATVTQNKK